MSKNKQTLCWNCTKATGGCSWSKYLLPVDGWEAEETFISNDRVKSFKVNKCPCFKSDKQIKIKDIATILQMNIRTLYRALDDKRTMPMISEILKLKGYQIVKTNNEKTKYLFLEINPPL